MKKLITLFFLWSFAQAQMTHSKQVGLENWPSSPSLVAGTNVTITGAFPNQTVNSSGGGGGSLPSGSANNFLVHNGTDWAAYNAAAALTAIGAQEVIPVGTGFLKNNGAGVWSWDNSTYLTTSSASSTYQPIATNLTSIGALSNASGWLFNNGSGTFSYSSPTSSTVGLGSVENTAISTWAGSINITTLGTITTGTVPVARVSGLGTLATQNATIADYLTSATAASTYQPLDGDITTIAGLTPTTDNFIVSVAGAWASRTPSQVRTTLGLSELATELLFASGNANKFVQVNSGGTGWQLTTLAGGGDALTTSGLNQFASTTSSEFSGVISDETGTGAVVLNVNPSINNIQGNFTSTATAAGTTTLTVSSNANQVFTGTTTQTAVMPDATTLTVGLSYRISNTSTGQVTVNANGGTLLKVISPGQSCVFEVTDISTSGGVWNMFSSDGESIITLTSSYTLTSQTAAQKIFNSSTNGAFNVVANTTYYFDCQYSLSSLSATSGAIGFAFGGTATFGTRLWFTDAIKATTLTTAGTLQRTSNTTSANTAITSANTSTSASVHVYGKLIVTTSGTIIPQVSLGIAAAGVVTSGSTFRIWPVGSNTFTNTTDFN